MLDARAVATWKVPTGMTCHVHAFDPREGGAFRISLTYDEPTGAGKTTAHTDTYHGRFVKLVPCKNPGQRGVVPNISGYCSLTRIWICNFSGGAGVVRAMTDEHDEPVCAQNERLDLVAVLVTLHHPIARGEKGSRTIATKDEMAWRLVAFQNTRIGPMGRSFAGTMIWLLSDRHGSWLSNAFPRTRQTMSRDSLVLGARSKFSPMLGKFVI
jgi:hypothetical protein